MIYHSTNIRMWVVENLVCSTKIIYICSRSEYVLLVLYEDEQRITKTITIGSEILQLLKFSKRKQMLLISVENYIVPFWLKGFPLNNILCFCMFFIISEISSFWRILLFTSPTVAINPRFFLSFLFCYPFIICYEVG